MTRYWRAVLKLSRFEVAVSVLASAAVLALWGYLRLRVGAVTVDPACLAGAVSPACEATSLALRAPVAGVGGRVLEAMRILPFGVGLLMGVPIVAREIESGTAQTTWSLNASRWRWLARQTVAVGVPAVLAVAAAAVAAADVESLRRASGDGGAVLNIGLYGAPAVARGLAGLAIGLLVGVLLGRAVPALVLGGLLCFAISIGAGAARDNWLSRQPAAPIPDGVTTSMTTGWAYETPTGGAITEDAAMSLVPASVSAADAGLPQPVNSSAWLESHGYRLVPVGVSEAAAMGWMPFDVGLFLVVATVCSATGAAVVGRRRPM